MMPLFLSLRHNLQSTRIPSQENNTADTDEIFRNTGGVNSGTNAKSGRKRFKTLGHVQPTRMSVEFYLPINKWLPIVIVFENINKNE